MANKVNKSFIKNSHLIADLKLCSIRLIDNSKFPWIILIPKRKNINDISELNSKDQILLMKEIVHCSKLMKKIFKTKKLNVEKIGNIVPQLHIHIIARSVKDSTWPLSVWVVKGKAYSKVSLNLIITKLKRFFLTLNLIKSTKGEKKFLSIS
jgi:diadenosine tetraphosphate (Ap4A) HIT family hydrolase